MLKGEKVYLRLLELRDIGILKHICNDNNIKKYNTIFNNEDENEISKPRKALSIINEKDVLVGFLTYKESNKYEKVFSIGITIASRYWNRGYGQDSIRLLIEYLFEELEAIKVQLEVIKYNIRAIACYEKCGFIQEFQKKGICYLDGKCVDTIIMGILKEEFMKRKVKLER